MPVRSWSQTESSVTVEDNVSWSIRKKTAFCYQSFSVPPPQRKGISLKLWNDAIHHWTIESTWKSSTIASSTNTNSQALFSARPVPNRDGKKPISQALASSQLRSVKDRAPVGSGSQTGSLSDNGKRNPVDSIQKKKNHILFFCFFWQPDFFELPNGWQEREQWPARMMLQWANNQYTKGLMGLYHIANGLPWSIMPSYTRHYHQAHCFQLDVVRM